MNLAVMQNQNAASVNAWGNTTGTIAVTDGPINNGFPTELIHGVGVQARSSENVFQLGAGGSAAVVAESIRVGGVEYRNRAHKHIIMVIFISLRGVVAARSWG